jgi:hypothetical protein
MWSQTVNIESRVLLFVFLVFAAIACSCCYSTIPIIIYEKAQTKDDANYYSLYSGQALRLLKRNQSAEEIVNEIMIQAKECLSILQNRLEGGLIIVKFFM